MARFKYLGAGWTGVTVGTIQTIRQKNKDGTTTEYEPVEPATDFVIDEDIGYDITDERALRSFRADPRFEEIV